MRKVCLEPLTLEGFAPFGVFAEMVKPEGEFIGENPVWFYRDILQLNFGGNTITSFSVCTVVKRPLIVDTTEFHSTCSEGILPLNGAVAIHVAPATPTEVVPHDKIRIFTVQIGTLVILKPGVWHHAPFVLEEGAGSTSVLIVLPERTYVNDCRVVELTGDQRVCFE